MNPLIEQILKPFTPEGQEMNFKEREAVVMEGGGDYSKTSIEEKELKCPRCDSHNVEVTSNRFGLRVIKCYDCGGGA